MPFTPDAPTQASGRFVPDSPSSGFIPDAESPYSPAGIAASRQALVQSEAAQRAAREEFETRLATPSIGIGLNPSRAGLGVGRFLPDTELRVDLPEEASAFISEAIKSSPATAAGIAAASGTMPLVNRLAPIPYVGAAARALPVIAGGAAAIGTRLAQDEYLPEVLPENLRQAYEISGELAGANPTSAMLGQFAGAGPFLRPGLPINTTGGARLAVPVIAGGIGGGIEGAQQIAQGDFDAQRLATATLGSALLNRETALGRRIGPNLVLPNIQGGVPSELGTMAAAMNEPRLPAATDVAPAELGAMNIAGQGAADDLLLAAQTGVGVDDIRVRRVAQRMMGVADPEQKLQILDQEVKLAGDTLTPVEERGALDLKQQLEGQVEAQKAQEAMLKDAEKAQANAQKMQAEQQRAAIEASKPPQIPKSAQILAEPVSKPPALANVATEVATQTKQSPYALQSALNEMTAPPQQIVPDVGVQAADQITTPSAASSGLAQIEPRAPIQPGEPIEAAVERLAANGETALAIAARTNSSVETVRRIAMENGYAIAEKSKVKPDIVMTPAPATFVGIQEGVGKVPDFELYNLTQDIPGHPAGSTVSRETLEKAGFEVPKAPEKTDVPTQSERIFYRGTNPESNQRIAEPFTAAKGKTFAARTVEGASQYGSSIEEIKAKPDAKILSDDSPEFWRVIGRKRPPNGYIGSSGKKGESLVSVVNDAIKKAEGAGYDAISIGDADIGTVILNEKAFTRGVSQKAASAPATAELRLNNAGMDLPPVSSLSAAQKLAELQAAGVTTYKGKPITDANPAQLSAAVGKLRRGQLADEIISKLQSAKIRRPGELSAAVEPFTLAYDAALDTAILGVRAGRAAADVIADAVTKFKELYPDHSDAELGRFRTSLHAIVDGKDVKRGRAAEDTRQASRMRETRGAIAIPGKQTSTPEFKKWFGESKVVDESGAPLVVYKAMYPKNWQHPDLADITSINRPSEFPAFNKGEKGVKIAGFFGDIPTANRFAESAGTGQAIFPTYLSLKKPFVIEAEGRFAGDVQFGESGKEFREAIRSGDYDGVIIRNTKDEGTIYVALEPTQIKSAIGNRGTFNPNDPDIRASIPAGILAPVAGAGAGGVTGFVTTDREPGESEEAFQARRLLNTAIGASIGGAGTALTARSIAPKAARPARPQQVPLPEVGEGQGIRAGAKKMIEDPAYAPRSRQTLAEDPRIIYDKVAQAEIRDTVAGATDAELVQMLGDPDSNIRIGALIEQSNRAAVTPGMEDEAARLRAQVYQQFTTPAQLLNMAKLVRSPEAVVEAVEKTLSMAGVSQKTAKKMTPAVRNTLYDLAKDNIAAEQRLAKAEAAAKKNFNDATVNELHEARKVLGKTELALDKYKKDILPEEWGKIISNTMKLNLLSPLSFSKNFFGNAVWQGLLRTNESLASAMDILYSQGTGKKREMMLYNAFPSRAEATAFLDGARIGSKELLTGPGAESYGKYDVQRGFHPLRAMAQVFSGVPAAERFMERKGIASLPRSEGGVPVNDRLKKLFEASLGISPEVSARLLALGDKPVRSMSEMRLLEEGANLRGLKGTARQKFLELPDAEMRALLETEGAQSILAQENKMATKVGNVLDTWIYDTMNHYGLGDSQTVKGLNKILGTLVAPFRMFPANAAMEMFSYAVPPLAFARGFVQARRGNRRDAMRAIAQGMMGTMFYGAANYLWEKGLISEPADPKDKKRRSVQYHNMGAQRINIDGLKRLQEGGDPTYRFGDETRDWGTMLGVAASPFYVFTKQQGDKAAAAARTGNDIPVDDKYVQALADLTGAASFAFDQSSLSGTSAFLDALKDWENNGDRFMENSMRAITGIVAPATVEAAARAKFDYIPELRGKNLTETVANIWEYKTAQLDNESRANLKRDLWGQPIRRTPEGRNPYITQFIDVTKGEAKPADPFKQALLEIYQQTGSTDVYPSPVDMVIEYNGTRKKLTPEDFDRLQEVTGKLREHIVKTRVLAHPRFSDPELIPEKKIMALQAAYSQGAKLAKDNLLKTPGKMQQYFPEYVGLTPTPEQEAETLSRDVKARARMRMLRGQ